MSNSFFYFFSATPQVLGAVLTLFGVFVIFRIQIIKSQLIGLGQSIIDEVPPGQRIAISLNEKMKTSTIIDSLQKAIKRYNVKELKKNVNLIEHPLYDVYRRNYNDLFDFLESLISSTIKWSILTACIIVLCLSMLTTGTFIINHNWLLYISFGLVILCIIGCFYGLITILIKSLKEKD
jgi:hypothetical protein